MPSLVESPVWTDDEAPGSARRPGVAGRQDEPPDSSPTLIDHFLAKQSRLTAVEAFSLQHDEHAFPAQARYYRDLIPATKPVRGEQYAFVVELDKCSGCKACVCACHSLNGLDEADTWRKVGLLVSRSSVDNNGGLASFRMGWEDAYQQHITTACHHCVEPGCAHGCPVLAYEKDPQTGIVRHLDDQCIGCQYCVLKCPYDVPKYSTKKGIVRKCDMCHSRLAAHEAPACVQACPHEAIRIELVDQTSMRPPKGNAQSTLVPGAFPSEYTIPTTRYQSSNPIPENARPVDEALLRVEAAHWPLVWMLILTQLAAGMHLLLALLAWSEQQLQRSTFQWAAAGALVLGLTLSVTHLGRPMKAWRAFLGWRRSWMSREIIAFALYTGLAVLLILTPTHPALTIITAAAGLVGVGCSAMIYIDTRRPSWAGRIVFTKFFGTTLLLGTTAGGALAGWFAPQLALGLAIAATLVRTALFAWEWAALLEAHGDPKAPTHRSARIAMRLLLPVLATRLGLFVASTVFSLMAIVNFAHWGAVWGSISFVTTLTSQVLERYMFFVSCPAPRMPGGAI